MGLFNYVKDLQRDGQMTGEGLSYFDGGHSITEALEKMIKAH